MKKLPLSIQTFEKIRQSDQLYVDKTKFIHQLSTEGSYYFLSRPRRFGKSLLLTTLKSFFEGKKSLFEGLYIHDKVENWETHPVIHIDYSLVEYKQSLEIFHISLLDHLSSIAAQYGLTLTNTVISNAFTELVQKLHSKYKQQVVVLVDEYDKPLVDVLGNTERFGENRDVLRNLYGAMKGLDGLLRFVMLTGVSRFAKVGVFSGMNNLDDISMNAAYGTIVGFTQEELEHNFSDHLQTLADHFSSSVEELMPHIREWYNGFSFDGEQRLYNPFSILKLFTEYEFRNYWFSTGTPTFLMNLIRKQKQLPEGFEKLKVIDLTGSSNSTENMPLMPLLYQTGYLTIERKGRDGLRPYYQLNYPNEEVRHSFLTYVTAVFLDKDQFEIQPESFALRDALIAENIDQFILRLQSIFADIPSRLHIAREAYYHSLTYLILRLVGAKPLLEKETDKGRIDAVLDLSDKIYIIEFKFATNSKIKQVSTLSRRALKQIKEKEYYQPYLGSGKRILLLGIGFLDKQLHGRVEELTASSE